MYLYFLLHVFFEFDYIFLKLNALFIKKILHFRRLFKNCQRAFVICIFSMKCANHFQVLYTLSYYCGENTNAFNWHIQQMLKQ